MSYSPKTHAIKVTGISDDLLKIIDTKVKSRRLAGRSEYIRDLIRSDNTTGQKKTLEQILGPTYVSAPETSEDSLDSFIEELRCEALAEKLTDDPAVENSSAA